MKKINVIIKRVGQRPYSTWISPTLENLQLHVDGYIEAITLTPDICLLVNEEGKIRNYPKNFAFRGDVIRGDVVLVGVKGDDFADLPVDYQTAKKLFPELWKETV